MRKIGLWRGLSGLFVGLMVFVIFATAILSQYASVINNALGVSTTTSSLTGSVVYESDFGEINAENLRKLEAAAEAQTIAEAVEGTVLLKNEDVDGKPALPLDVTREKNVTLFGRATYSPLYKTSAAVSKADETNPDRLVSLDRALKEAGFATKNFFDSYADKKVGKGKYNSGYSYQFEEAVGFYEAQQGNLAGYKDVAIVMLTRSAGEGIDMAVDQSTDAAFKFQTKEQEKNSLALQTNEKDMLNFVKAQGYKKIVVLINTNYMMELDWFDEYGVDAALYIGTPGLTGFTGVVNVLTGKDGLSPSGRLADTFAADSLSSPAIANAAGNTPQWKNASSNAELKALGVNDLLQETSWVDVQQESIYVGYKYYETRYADAISGDEGARSAVGSSFDGGWDYAKEMCYPFGYGLGYTTFRQTISKVQKNEEDHSYTVTVKVENTGTAAGKDAVLVYVNTPYGEYEKARKIEKSAILFAGFSKTGVIAPGGSEEVDVEVDEYLFASYDYTDTKGYVLTAGDYYFAVGGDAHTALNNVLGAMGKTGLVDQDGNAVTPDKDAVYHWEMELDTQTYKYGEDGETLVTNRFDEMDINHWEGNDVPYLTRSDWAGTFPVKAAEVTLKSGEMAKLLQGEWYEKAADAPSTDIYAQGKSNNWNGVDNGISFAAMKDVAYDDEEKWTKFIDQFDLSELVLMTGNNFGNIPIASQPINLPEKWGGDGCQGIGGERGHFSETLTQGEAIDPCLYTSVLGCTFNKELIEKRGNLMGNEALFLDATVIWTGGGNLRRTPFGGRNAEYWSEDANLTYLILSVELPAMEKKGILGGVKHFAGNDQESHREGLNTFYNEQAFREGALRGFEGALKKGKVHSVMQSFSRQGVIFSSSCAALNIGVLREEWGFEGQVITDASSGVLSGYKAHYVTTMANGTNMYCLDGKAVGGGIVADYIKANDDGVLLGYLRDSAKNIAYSLSRSAAVNGLAEDDVISSVTPVWQIMTYVAEGIFIALALGSVTMFVIAKVLTYRDKKGERQ